jgi:K+-transporting ATPase ATPase C chain
MLRLFKPALLIFLALTILTGVVYPVVVTVMAQSFFPHQANGSIILLDGKAAGSELIGQSFDDPKYFWGRLSATAPAYNAAASSGSNYGPLHASLKDAVKARIEALKKADPSNTTPVPVDLVTASGSGLDPHTSLAAIYYQIPRVARARGLSQEQINKLIQSRVEGRWLGIFGEPVVNVLRLNLILDARQKNQSLDFNSPRHSDGLPKFMKWGLSE